MQNYKAPGDVLTVVAPYALSSGDGCKVGAIFGVAIADSLISENVQIKTEGVFELVKVGSQAWAKGDRIYWDDGNKRCTSEADGMYVGNATEVAGAGAGVVLGTLKLAPALLSTGNQITDAENTAPATAGGATPSAAQVDAGIVATTTPIRTQLNALLAELRVLGVISSP